MPWYLEDNGGLLAIGLFALLVFYPIGLAIRRLFFSELSGFPGPKLAAASYWPESYHDWFRRGKYIFEIEKMHDRYGKKDVNSTSYVILR